MGEFESSNTTMYIAKLDGSYTPFGQVEDFDCTCSDSMDDLPYSIINNLSDFFEGSISLSPMAFVAFWGFRNLVINYCPNKRVVHLALHAKKARTRKKNFRRAIKILEEFK